MGSSLPTSGGVGRPYSCNPDLLFFGCSRQECHTFCCSLLLLPTKEHLDNGWTPPHGSTRRPWYFRLWFSKPWLKIPNPAEAQRRSKKRATERESHHPMEESYVHYVNLLQAHSCLLLASHNLRRSLFTSPRSACFHFCASDQVSI